MYHSRSNRKRQILTQIFLAWLKGHRLTAHEIASRVGLVPSQHLRQILYEMVTEGYLYCKPVAHRPHITKMLFSYNPRGTEAHDPESANYLAQTYGRQTELWK